MIQNRTPINFLKHVFSEDVASVANILVAEAEDNYDHIIAALTAVGNKVQEWITRLEQERDEKMEQHEDCPTPNKLIIARHTKIVKL